MTRVVLRRAAELDILEAALSYEGERDGLGIDFEVQLDATLDHIGRNPRLFLAVESEIRRALVSRFPYGVYFVLDNDEAVVLAVLHLHRDPETWKTRR